MAATEKVTWVDEYDTQPWRVNKDLLEEREQASFKPVYLTYLLDGSEQRTHNRRHIELLVYNDPDLQHDDIRYMSREERYETALRKCILIVKKRKELGIEDEYDKYVYTSTAMGMEQAPFALHHVMFMPALSGQGTREQQEKWMTLAENYAILGTYAQTEIGHGTYLRGLETTATYDADTEEFVIHSPTLTSTKFWPGALGHTSNHAVVLAQLYTGGQCHGVHAFIVQIRSREDHTPMPGVTLGDIGPKNGYESMDNGYLRLDQVRIPRDNMLMRNAQVSPRGVYQSRPSTARLTLATMMFVRAMLVTDMARHLARAVTIAVRYSAVRRQGAALSAVTDHTLPSHATPRPSHQAEEKLLNYTSQQHKLLPRLTAAYLYMFIGNHMRWMYFSSIEKIMSGDVHLLPELHALSAGIKAVSVGECVEGVERCRECCGGHGFSQSSGFQLLYASAAPASTYEGDNTVLLLQTARYLVKSYRSVSAGAGGELASSVRYLSAAAPGSPHLPPPLTAPPHCSPHLTAPPPQGAAGSLLQQLIEVYHFTAYWSVVSACTSLDTLTSDGRVTHDVAWNMCHTQLITAARMHCQYYMLSTFRDLLSEMLRCDDTSTVTTCPDASQRHSIVTVLTHCATYYALHHMITAASDFISAAATAAAGHSEEQGVEDRSVCGVMTLWLGTAPLHLSSLTPALRSQAVPLCDAFDFHDSALCGTALGCYDGHVYERVLAWARGSPMNRAPVHRAYTAHLRDFLKGQERQLLADRSKL